jgi:hypothetical protein
MFLTFFVFHNSCMFLCVAKRLSKNPFKSFHSTQSRNFSLYRTMANETANVGELLSVAIEAAKKGGM